MSERSDLLTSLASTIEDYRVGDLAPRTPDDVDRWIQQFAADIQVPLLRELDHVLKQTYFTKANVSEFFSKLISQKALAGDTPCEYWQRAHFLDIQQQGHSQAEIRQVFGDALTDQCGVGIDNCGADSGDYLYLETCCLRAAVLEMIFQPGSPATPPPAGLCTSWLSRLTNSASGNAATG